MCGETLKSEIAFQKEDAHEIHTGILREVLRSLIRNLGETPEQFVRRPGRDFTRARTRSFETLLPTTMETLFQRFTACLRPAGHFQGYRLLLACDRASAQLESLAFERAL